MEIEREEGGRITPFKSHVTDGTTVYIPRAEGSVPIWSGTDIMLAEVLRGIEHLSQQMYEAHQEVKP